ncbi:OmpA family protein [Mitsuaria sp. GD03876]|uniref:OmpA family protein n=1 Tax=Mitsuaria sp. GD03876 TaxID=2975399 RepID=UPI00244D2B2C|nr:OmpA family protein [Mitsuaria sp. GD03876]MDH0865828.1 OmpA family protein [Mitsuaria sp. GD03876]
MGIRAVFVGVALVLTTVAASAQDVKGGKDHPLISRYQGSRLIAWRTVPFAEVKPLKMLTEDIAKEKKLDPALSLEGEMTELFYLSPKGKNALEVQRNYETALKQGGAAQIYSCQDGSWGCYSRGGPAGDLLLNQQVPPNQQQGSGTYDAFGALSTNLRLSVFKLSRAGVDTFITVYSVDSPNDSKPFGGSAATYLQIVQPKAVETGKVSLLDAKQIGSGLSAEGKISLYGIFFDTGKADVKPESKPQLAEMAKVLQASPALKVFIVGHTDNQGQFDANLALSQRRAEAIVAALAKDYKVDAKRLAARGVANVSPVASNGSEAGRAKNRRVEMVEQ